MTRSISVCICGVEMPSAPIGRLDSDSTPRTDIATRFRNTISISMVTNAIPAAPTSVISRTTWAGALTLLSSSRLAKMANTSFIRRFSWVLSELVYSSTLFATPAVPITPPNSENMGINRSLLRRMCPSGVPFFRSLLSPS